MAIHSTRSNSCIAPVQMNIRRLSGGQELVEEIQGKGGDPDGDGDDKTIVASPASRSSSARSSFTLTRSEMKRREALWDLFQSEAVFMYNHLMVLKNVFMEPLKKIQVILGADFESYSF